MRFISAVFCAVLAVSMLADTLPAQTPAPAQSSSVTLPLTRYEELQKSAENASATVIDTLSMAGTFRDHNLTLTFAGRSVGTRATTTVISGAPDLTLSGCSGDALIVRSSKGVYDLIALAPSFTLRCDARPSGSDRIRMDVAQSVLAVRSSVADGELVPGEDGADDVRGYSLVRQVGGGSETLAATATGRYLITLLPDTTRFRYVIQIHNPNRNTSSLLIHLVSGEHLQQIDSAAPYEPKDGSYVFAMPPGDSTITITGELQGTTFTPPVEASLQYVVVESHPLLRPAMKSAAKRLSTGETGITTQYRGALAFEIGPRERIAWTVTRLEALRAISYAVRDVSHTLFVPANGPVLGESNLLLDNQGAPEVVLPPNPEPTFVSLQDEPVLMTKNAAGELTVPLSAGQQHVIVQHRQGIAHFSIVFAQLQVPRLPVPATYTNVTVRYPEHWIPVWQSFATRGTTWRPETESMIAFLLLTLWLERVLAFVNLRVRTRVIAALFLAFASMVIPVLLWIVVLGCGAVTFLWLAAQRRAISFSRMLAVGAAAVLLLVLAFFYTSMSKRAASDYTNSVSPVARNLPAGVPVSTETVVTDSVAQAPPPPPSPKAAPRSEGFAFQGLPAKFELPVGVQSESFSEQLLSPERPQTITLVLLSMTLVTWAAIVLALIAAWILWREHATIKESVRGRLAEATAVAPAVV
ncbi:MAG: hypothetical protein JO093_24130 [Acidobacteria bacterium]|nr:hypothetical protein [Acidobacteriota bacterium]MBV9068433.1 hypothetical protein [Acidobacteriota bacterium]MBV9188719.1 hypothetical protein [Acidobacteriota bacterium]